ncbi:fibronectin type III domain-containing protein [Aquimarina sp. AU58]|uniref:fibronectin type III domain-containing protein n=1 Tax=Aquimarina sp. AU58 TaxID=1874112 RepID=UPI000D64190F|nr:fibronectin type III domain-containing protein [Aquimarina sp. AU58]
MKKLILTLFIILYGFGQMMAQRFPITVVPQVNPPAPVNFYNYADQATINSPLRVQLLLSDITISNEQIRLKVYFEGNGIAFESRDVVIGASPLFIDGGVPLVLTNTVLAPYFEFQNIKGINSNIYGSTIPEGSYQFCFEVFDFSTGNRLSSKTCASAFIYNNEPPLLNLPFKGTNIEPTEVENIVFQWTPRHINVSNVAYELSIVEIWDDQVDPQTAFLSQVPVFETTTKSTSFVYGPAQPQLLPEKRYAWRVKAKALQGIEEVGLFKNEGNSEIFWFSKTSPCSMLDNVTAAPKGISKINVFWGEDPSEYSEYTIAYREANRPNAYWFTKRTNSGWTTIWDLKPGTTYEYKVKAKCKYQYGEYSDVQEVTTDTTQDETANYDCGITPDPIAIANQEGHPGLKIGDRITAGDFIVRIVEIDNQANGRITGRGYVGIPYLRSTHYGVKFNNILINTENQLAAGEIVTLYDPVYGESETMTVDINTDVVEIITGDEGETSQVEVGFVIESITINEHGAVIITGTNGEEALVPGGRDLQISGSDGKVWKVEENGTVTALDGVMAEDGPATDDNTEGVEDNEIMQISETGVLVTFIESGYYNFDALPDSAKDKLGTEEFYPSIPVVGGGTYTPAFKAISNISGNDFVKAVADFSDDSIANEDIVFKTKSGVEIPASWDQNVATLTLKKSYDYAVTKVLATVKKGKGEKSTIAGVLNVVHLGSKAFTDVNIVLIPVNKAKVNRVEGEIKKIYSKVGVNFNITVGQRFQVPESIWDKEEPYGVLNAGDSGLLSHYSAEEAAINAYFKTTSEYRQDAYYVFVTDLKGVNSNGNREIEGFMPLKSQFGYIFQGATDDARTIAHELGHGVFGLEHPFEEYGTTEATTHFMMDYKGGTAFNHMDWKNIFAPGFKLYWFQGDEDGESSNSVVKTKNEKVKIILDYFKKRYNGVDENLIWKSFIVKRNGREELIADLKGVYNFNFPDHKLNFELTNHPSSNRITIKVDTGKETFEIKEHTFGGVYYELTIKTDHEDFVFEFDHHDELEAFCNYFKIDRKESFNLPYLSNYSKQIIDYLNTNYFPEDGISKNTDCDNIDTYFAEMPAGYLSYIHDTTFLSKDKLWVALEVLLNCSVDDKGVSEEDAIINIIEALGKGSETLLLKSLSTQKFNGENVFRKLYDKLDNWGGKDNFTRLINAFYNIWKETEFTSQPVHNIAYESRKIGVFFTSPYILDFKEGSSTSITLSKKVHKLGEGVVRKDLGTYDIYTPIRLTRYEKIAKPGFNIQSVDVPIFILKAIDENYSTNNIDQGINLAFEAALTASGIGNVTKLRHLKDLGKLKNLLDGLKGVETILSTTNLILKYSDACAKPNPTTITQPGEKKGMTYCQILGALGDVLGLGTGLGDLATRSTQIAELSRKLEKKIVENPRLIEDGADKARILKGLKQIVSELGDTVNLSDLKKIYTNGTLRTILYDFENVKLGLSTIDVLLKHSEKCDADETCKAIKLYLGFIQQGIKAKDLGSKLKQQTSVLLGKIKNDPKFLQDKPAEKKRLVEGLEVAEGTRISKLKTVLSDLPENKHQNIKQLYDNASPDKKASLEKSWEILEPFRNIRFANDGKNLEILAKTHDRFTYDDQDSFLGLKKLMVEGSTANKQKLIDGLEEANKIFDSKLELPIKFSGIKKGEVKIVDSENTEIARIDTEGNLIKKKFLDEADGAEIVGKYNEDVILRKGKEVGFKKINKGPVTTVFFKNVDEFAATFDKTGTVNQTVRKQAFDLYKKGKWGELEDLFNKHSLNDGWPPAKGGYNIVDNVPIKKGQKFDRYGGAFGNTPNGNPNLGGSFTSPVNNNKPYNFGQRALDKTRDKFDFYYEIEVLKDLSFTSQNADVIPWFSYIGGGKQALWDIPKNPNSADGHSYTLSELAEMGLIKITIKDSPNGKYSELINTVIEKK